MQRSTTTTLLTVAALSAGIGIAAYELYTRPRLRRRMQARTYETMAMALAPLSRMTNRSRRNLGRRFGMDDVARDAEKKLARAERKLSRTERRLRDEAEAERLAGMVGM